MFYPRQIIALAAFCAIVILLIVWLLIKRSRHGRAKASLPSNLIESELFGHEKGAFTGAHARQLGQFEVADGATLFLDEIGKLPLELQPKLLRVIQDGEFERLASSGTIKVDVRVVAATNRGTLRARMRKLGIHQP